MTGITAIRTYQRLLEQCDKLGFAIGASRHGGFYPDKDIVAVSPKDQESLPIYSRDAEIFVGSIEELEVWLRGVQWARDYDCMLKVSDDKKRACKEQDYRNRELVQILKNEPKES